MADSKVKKAESIHKLVQEISDAKKHLVGNFLVIGRNLTVIQETKLWRYYGDHLKNIRDFFKELGFSNAKGYHYINIWKQFGEYLLDQKIEVEYLGVARLQKLLPLVNDENKADWVAKANTIPRMEDFDNEIKEAKGMMPTDQCECLKEMQEFYTRCSVCDKYRKRDKSYFKELCLGEKEKL